MKLNTHLIEDVLLDDIRLDPVPALGARRRRERTVALDYTIDTNDLLQELID